MRVSLKKSIIDAVIIVFALLFLAMVAVITLAIVYDDRSMPAILTSLITFLFWPGALLPHGETWELPPILVGFWGSFVVYSALITVGIEGVKHMREK